MCVYTPVYYIHVSIHILYVNISIQLNLNASLYCLLLQSITTWIVVAFMSCLSVTSHSKGEKPLYLISFSVVVYTCIVA